MKKFVKVFMLMLSLVSMFALTGCGKEEETAKTFKGKNVRVVIGSTSTDRKSVV